MEKPLQINELVVDDPNIMRLDTPQRVYELGQLVISATQTLDEDFPEAHHLLIVRVGQRG